MSSLRSLFLGKWRSPFPYRTLQSNHSMILVAMIKNNCDASSFGVSFNGTAAPCFPGFDTVAYADIPWVRPRFLARLVFWPALFYWRFFSFLAGYYFKGKLKEQKDNNFMKHYHPFYDSLMDDFRTRPLVSSSFIVGVSFWKLYKWNIYSGCHVWLLSHHAVVFCTHLCGVLVFINASWHIPFLVTLLWDFVSCLPLLFHIFDWARIYLRVFIL